MELVPLCQNCPTVNCIHNKIFLALKKEGNPALCNNMDEPGACLVSYTLKTLPVMRETQVRSLGWEDPLAEGMATHSSILAWRICMDRGVWWAAVHRVAKSRTRLKG